VVDEIVHDMNEVKKEKQKIIYSSSSNGELMSDKHLVKNILINLLSNAIKFQKKMG